MRTSTIVYIVIIVLLVGAILSFNNLNTTLEDIKNTQADASQEANIESKEVLAGDLVSRLRNRIKEVQDGNQSVSEIGVKFYEPTN